MASRINIVLKGFGKDVQTIEISETTETEALRRMFEHLSEIDNSVRVVQSIEIFGAEVYRRK